jgi:hypothetical protein
MWIRIRWLSNADRMRIRIRNTADKSKYGLLKKIPVYNPISMKLVPTGILVILFHVTKNDKKYW